MLMCGLLDENWSAYQDHLPNVKKKDRGKEWNAKLSCWLIREARQVWLNRNEEVFSPDNGNSKAEQEILAQVRHLYEQANEIGQHDRAIFDEPIENKLSQPTATLKQWVKNTIPTVSKCIRNFREKLATNQSDMRNFFKPRKTGTTTPTQDEAVADEQFNMSG